MLRGKDVHELEEMKQSGLSVSAISEVTRRTGSGAGISVHSASAVEGTRVYRA
jgi:hypothetical protein